MPRSKTPDLEVEKKKSIASDSASISGDEEHVEGIINTLLEQN